MKQAILLKDFNIWKIILFIKYSTFNIILHIEIWIVNLKIIFEKKQKPNPRPGREILIITEMAIFTLETDYSCETGYPFDGSRQIGNTS